MTETTRFNLAKAAVVVAGIAGAFTLTACSGSGTLTASGRLDDTRYLPGHPAVTRQATHLVPVYSRQCTTKFRTSTTGSGKFRKTSRTSYQDCKNVRTGSRSEVYTRTVRAALAPVYCVELDDLGGHKSQDDKWFRVDSVTYHRWAGKPEGVKVNKMHYQASGCYQH